MSECDATVGQVAKGTTASFELGPHGASVCGRTEHALPGVGVVGGVWALVGAVFGLVALGLVSAGGVFWGRIVPFAPAVGVFSCVGEGADGVCGVFGGVALDFVPADGVDVDEIGVFGALGVVFWGVGGRSDGVCRAFGGRIVLFAPVGAVFSGVGEGSDGVCGAFGGVCGVCAFAVGVFGSAAAACGSASGETGAKRSASDGAGGADVDEATEEGAAERRLD